MRPSALICPLIIEFVFISLFFLFSTSSASSFYNSSLCYPHDSSALLLFKHSFSIFNDTFNIDGCGNLRASRIFTWKNDTYCCTLSRVTCDMVTVSSNTKEISLDGPVSEELLMFHLFASYGKETIRDAFEDSITWPVRKIVPILPGDYSDLELKPVGTLEVKLVQAKNLTNKDLVGKSDPCALIYIRPLSDRIKTSKTITVRIFYDEGVQASELIGCAHVALKDLIPGKVKDAWAASELIRNNVEPILEQYRPVVLSSLKFSKLTLGTVAPQFTGVSIIDEESKSGAVTMELEMQWDGHPNIVLDVKTRVGVGLPIQSFGGFHTDPGLCMDSKSVVDLIEASSGVHFSGFHMNGLEQRHTEVEQPTTSATYNMHKQPFVIEESSDLFTGHWVQELRRSLYTNSSCAMIPDSKNCFKNGREDNDFLNWRWKPNERELPRFDLKAFLETVRGKKMAFIGDSATWLHLDVGDFE
ncbi:hypothetical protein FNV43_RR21843 [Rhamnella rubrinervis]|uniref:Uncharacterized protein n=1 Tax=Rhamnella rubrinervis TaxID=2594499 RepID=A0A8K0GRZ5_9ROSA|nr:hypothetical protein FNV43_RR21843 [Rhamnella rubrinervis]